MWCFYVRWAGNQWELSNMPYHFNKTMDFFLKHAVEVAGFSQIWTGQLINLSIYFLYTCYIKLQLNAVLNASRCSEQSCCVFSSVVSYRLN